MRAAVYTRYGPPDVVSVREVAAPAAGDREVLVRVHATTVNRTDCGFRAASPPIVRLFTGLARPRVTILGTTFAGQVAAVGPAVTSFRPGDRVFGYVEGRPGSHAEYLAVPEDASIAPVPADLAYAHAAAGTEGSHYALAFVRAANIHHGHDVLVYGATGAIGSAAVQLARHLGAEVTAVCDTAHLDLVRGLGAGRVIDRTATDFTRDPQRFDAVLDAVGKSSYGRCRRLLKPGGVYLSSDLGRYAANPALALLSPLFGGTRVFGGGRVKFPIPRHDQSMIRYLAGVMASGAFTPVIDRHYPLQDIVAAYRYVESGQKVGNVVIDIVPGDV